MNRVGGRLDRTNNPHWVYRCYDNQGRLVYVGSTADLFGRLDQHRKTSWWAPTVARVTAKVYPDGPTGRVAEREAIRDEVPRWNLSGKWIGRHRWQPEDWHDWMQTLIRGTERPLAGMSSQLRCSIADYAALFNLGLPPHIEAQVARLERADLERERRSREERAARVADLAKREADELAAARRKKRGPA